MSLSGWGRFCVRVCVCQGWRVRGGVNEEAQTVSEDDTHNEECRGCVILIIPLTPPHNLILFDSAQQPWWRSSLVCTFVCAGMCVCVGKRENI